MNIIIESLDFTAKQELQDFVTKKVKGLSERAQNAIGAVVKLKLDKNDSRENKICEIRIEIPGNDLFASRQKQTFEEAVQEVTSALRKQIEKGKRDERQAGPAA